MNKQNKTSLAHARKLSNYLYLHDFVCLQNERELLSAAKSSFQPIAWQWHWKPMEKSKQVGKRSPYTGEQQVQQR